jgi:hypothetical protein
MPLDLQETHSYIEFRLRQAGWRGNPEISGAAVHDIFRYSNGVPRHINKLCNRLLLLGYATGSHTLDREQVQTIISEMGAEQLSPMADEPSSREAGFGVSDEPVLPRKRLSELAIRSDEPLCIGLAAASEPASVDDKPTNHPLAGENLDERFETGELTVPASVLQFPLHLQDRSKPDTRSRHPVLAASLVIVTVAVLSLVVLTDRLEKDAGQPLARMLDKSGHPHAKQAGPLVQSGLSAGVDTEPVQSITDSEYALLQRVLNDELPATAVGNLSSDTATATDVQTDTPLDEVHSFVSQAEYIDYLLERGQRALEENRLLTPALNSAYYYFQGVLRLTPGNRIAAKGIQQIVERYVVLTNKALEQQDGIMANRYIARGLSIQPGNHELLALKQRSPEPVLEEAIEAPVQSSRLSFDQLLSRIKTFFTTAARSRPESPASYQLTSSVLYE